MRPTVICIGSTSKDIFFPTGEGVILETPEDVTAQTKVAFELGGKFQVKDRFEAVGGVAANVATGLAKLGIPSYCYSKVGRDDIGAWIQKELSQHEVKLETLFVDPHVKSDVSAIIVITQTADRLIFHNRDANEKLEIIPEEIPPAEWLFVSALNGPWEENIEKIMAFKKKQGLHLALNPGQHNLKENSQLILGLLPEISLLVLNKDEAIELLLKTGLEENEKHLNDEAFLVRRLHEEGASVVALTDGKRGAWTTDGKKVLSAPIYEQHGLVDTTGAGDAFASGFLAAHLLNHSLETCLQYGIANGGNVVGFFGAEKGLLTQEEIHASLSKISVHQVISASEG